MPIRFYETILDLHQERQAVDLVTLTDALRSRGLLESRWSLSGCPF